jgi:hypothetical protein
MWVQLGVVILTGSFAIYRDVLTIFTWYIVPPRTIEPATIVKPPIRKDTCQYPFAEIYW